MQIPAAHLIWLPHIVLSKKELFPTILSLLGALAFFHHAYHHIRPRASSGPEAYHRLLDACKLVQFHQ